MTFPGPPPNPIGGRGRLASDVAEYVDRVPGVRRVGGTEIEIGTQHAGGTVLGVAVSDTEVAIHLVVSRFPIDQVSDEVSAAARDALRLLGDTRPVVVHVDDVDLTLVDKVRFR